jgi:trigger factor
VQVQVEKTKSCVARVSFTVPADEFQAELRAILTQAGRQARIKGFRPGKVPANVVERLHGTEARREARQRFVQKAYDQAMKENELRPLAHPRVDIESESAPDADFALEFEVNLRPKIELSGYKGLAIETALEPVSDAEVEAAIEQVRQNQARPEPAGEGGLPEDGMALCKVELLHEGQVVFTRDGLRLGPRTAVPGVDAEAFKAALTGAVDGATVEVPVTFPADFEVEAARGATGTCRLTVAQAFRVVVPTREELPALLDLADDAALVERVREKLDEANRQHEEQRIETELLGRVIDAHDFELPEVMVAEQTRARLEQTKTELRGQGASDAEVDAHVASHEAEARKGAERTTKAYFLIEAIGEAEEIKIGEAELREELKAIATRNRSSFEEVARYYQEQNLFGQLAMEILERKVRGLLRASADLKSPAV